MRKIRGAGLFIVFLLSQDCVCTIFPFGQDCSYLKRYSAGQPWMVGRAVNSAQPLLLENFSYSWTNVFQPISVLRYN